MKAWAVAVITLKECAREPAGAVLCLLATLLMLMAPTYSVFALGEANNLLRSNLLSTQLLGGTLYVAMISNSVFSRDLDNHAILGLLSKPLSITSYYLGKLLGVMVALFLFHMVLACISWLACAIGVKETASTTVNFLPCFLLIPGLILLVLTALTTSYTFGWNTVGTISLGWPVLALTSSVLTALLSPALAYPVPDWGLSLEMLKSTIVLHFLLMVIASLSLFLSCFTGPVLNFMGCMAFLLAGLMSPGLAQLSGQTIWADVIGLVPNLHTFWTAEPISVNRIIPLSMLWTGIGYGLLLCAFFTSTGIWLMHRKEMA